MLTNRADALTHDETERFMKEEPFPIGKIGGGWPIIGHSDLITPETLVVRLTRSELSDEGLVRFTRARKLIEDYIFILRDPSGTKHFFGCNAARTYLIMLDLSSEEALDASAKRAVDQMSTTTPNLNELRGPFTQPEHEIEHMERTFSFVIIML